MTWSWWTYLLVVMGLVQLLELVAVVAMWLTLGDHTRQLGMHRTQLRANQQARQEALERALAARRERTRTRPADPGETS